MRNLNSLSEIEKKEFFDSLDSVLTDCDGVTWFSSVAIPGAVEVINRLKEAGKNVLFVTNDSTKTRKDLLETCIKLGFQVNVDEMITSAWLTSVYLKSINFNKKVFLIGRKAVADELNNVNIECFGFGPDHYTPGASISDHVVLDPDVAAVVVGYDIDISYPKMIKACNYLKDPNCLFVGTNIDTILPLAGGIRTPGAGTIVKSIETCTERKAIIVGKPSKVAVDVVLKSKGLNPKRALMIGDRCKTDIAFGNACSMRTLVVLTGFETLEMIKEYEKNNQNHLIPTYYADSIADLLKVIEDALNRAVLSEMRGSKEKNQEAVIMVEIDEKQSIYGYNGNVATSFLKISVALPRLIATTKRVVEKVDVYPQFPDHHYQAFEANIDFDIRLFFLGISRVITHRQLKIIICTNSISRFHSSQNQINARTMRNLNSLSEIEKKEFLDSLDSVLTDCDGVTWLSSVAIPGAVEVINRLKEVGKNVLFVTNNSTKSRMDLLEKSIKLGFQVNVDEMITSAWLTSVYLKSINFNKKVFLIGRKAVADELNNVNIECFGFGPDHYAPGATIEDHVELDPDVAAVVVGHDIDISYPKMTKACNYLKDPNCLFVGTNIDPILPLAGGIRAPGAGTFVKSIETCTERKAIVVGKPSKVAVDVVLKNKGLNPKRALMIGDRCITDIAFGNACSMRTLLVFTGIETLEMIKEYEKNNQNHLIPTYYADSIADLLKVIEVGRKK